MRAGSGAGHGAEKVRAKADRGGGTGRQYSPAPACLTQGGGVLVALRPPGLGFGSQWQDKASCPGASSTAYPVRMTAFCCF